MITTSAPRSRPCLTASKATEPGSESSGAGHELDVGALAPTRQLLDGGGAERVGRAEHDGLAELLAQVPGELADRRRLAGAVDADGQDHGRLVAQVDRSVAGLGDAGQQLDEALLQRLAALDARRLVASCSSCPTTPAVVRAPTSAMISASSSRSHVSSSSVLEERRLDLGGERLAGLARGSRAGA